MENLKLHYVWDAYCGWCYGFSDALSEFHKNHPELPLQVLSGGLFVESKKAPISDYPHIPGANARIAELTGVTFGQNYQNLLEEGHFVLDSEAAARGFAALQHFAPNQSYEFATSMQKKFYVEGKSLSEEQTYREIAVSFNLDADSVIARFTSKAAENEAIEAFQTVASMNINSYPTLLLQKGDALIKIGGGAMTADKLEQHLERALNNE